MEKLTKPFSQETIDRFERYQLSGIFHPYTCDHCRPGLLKMNSEGLYCTTCDYTQNWTFSLPNDDDMKNFNSFIKDLKTKE